MSIGNLKDYGNKANNFPWQLKVLQGLQAILDQASQPLTCVDDSVSICSDGTPVGTANPLPVDVNITEANDSILIYGSDGANNVPILVDSFGAVAIQDNGDFISVDSGAIQKTQNVLRISGASGALAPGIYSAMSFASVGTADATVDGVILKPGEVINIDAGGINNVLGGLSYDTTNVDSELLIITLI